MKKLIGLFISLAVIGLLIMVGAFLTQKASPLSGDVSNDPQLVKRGAYLATAGDCVACHTAKGGAPFAGGLAMPIPILGTIYSPNITSDKQSGIGDWSLAEFDRAVRYGVAKGKTNLYPAMPYVSFAKLTDDDVKALYAYFKYSVPPSTEPSKKSKIVWPLDIRWPIQYWNLAFTDTKPYQPKKNESEAWNRGAYLAQGLAHCGMCHTPRGFAMQQIALDESKTGYLGGSVLGGWEAFNITSHPISGIGAWSEGQLERYLSTGSVNERAQAAGPMGDAVEHSFSHLSHEDIAAIATFVKSTPPYNDGAVKSRSLFGAPAEFIANIRGAPSEQSVINPQQIFLGACATCHRWNGSGSGDGYYPSLYRNSVMGARNPSNLTKVILHGVERQADGRDFAMPGFKAMLTNAEVVTLVNTLTKQFGDPDAKKMTEDEVEKLRSDND